MRAKFFTAIAYLVLAMSGCSSFPAKPPIIAAPLNRRTASNTEAEQADNLRKQLDHQSLQIEWRIARETSVEEKEGNPILIREILDSTQCHGYGADFRFSPKKDRVLIYEPFSRATANPDQQPRIGGYLLFAEQINGKWNRREQISLPPHQGFWLEKWSPSQRLCIAMISYPNQTSPPWAMLVQAGYCSLVVDFEEGSIYQIEDETRSLRDKPYIVQQNGKQVLDSHSSTKTQ